MQPRTSWCAGLALAGVMAHRYSSRLSRPQTNRRFTNWSTTVSRRSISRNATTAATRQIAGQATTPGIDDDIDRPPAHYLSRLTGPLPDVCDRALQTRRQLMTATRHPLGGFARPGPAPDRRVTCPASARSRSILTNTRSTLYRTERRSHLSHLRQHMPITGRIRRPIVTESRTKRLRSSISTIARVPANSGMPQNIRLIQRGCYPLSHRVSVTTLTSDTHLSAGAPALRSPRTRSHLMLCPPVRAARTEKSVRDEPRSASLSERIDGASIETHALSPVPRRPGRAIRPRASAPLPAVFAVTTTKASSAEPRYRLPEDSAPADLRVTA